MALLDNVDSRPLSEFLVDTGVRTGKTVIEIDFNAALVAGNTFNSTINGVAIAAVPFNTNSNTTMDDIAAAYTAHADIITAVAVMDADGNKRTINITSIDRTNLILTLTAVSGGATQAQLNIQVVEQLRVLGALLTWPMPRSSNSNITAVASSITSVQLLPANPNRLFAMLSNVSTSDVYVKFGATASSISHTVRIPANGYYEVPATLWTGRLDAIWVAANGNMVITELT